MKQNYSNELNNIKMLQNNSKSHECLGIVLDSKSGKKKNLLIRSHENLRVLTN